MDNEHGHWAIHGMKTQALIFIIIISVVVVIVIVVVVVMKESLLMDSSPAYWDGDKGTWF